MSGLLALLDDVAAIAKVAATSVDDVAAQAAKAGAKAAGAVIDDAAVTPKYVQGFSAARELPIIWRIAKGSVRNKVLVLLPAALLLSAFAPWAIPPLLMLGGAYLCFEGAEKFIHMFQHATDHSEGEYDDPAHLEEAKVAGAIKTDFVLSAEIMTIALSALPAASIWFSASALFFVAIGITALVYGSVAVIVKADDVGLMMARRGRWGLTRRMGRGIVAGMPGLLKGLSFVGTLAMLWVGGSIVIHGLEPLGLGWVAYGIENLAERFALIVPVLPGLAEWGAKAAMDGVFALILGLLLLPIGTKIIAPIWGAVTKRG